MNARLSVLSACWLALTAGCRPLENSGHPELVLRTYDVPQAAAGPIRIALNSVFVTGPSTGGEKGAEPPKYVARADVAPGGKLIVLASEPVQAGVQALVDEVRNHPPAAQQTVELRYWLVEGYPEAKPAAPGPDLQDVQSALEAISRTDGPLEFKLVQKLRVSSLVNERGEAEGARAKVVQQASVSGNQVVADIRFEFGHLRHHELNTRISVTPEQTVVLGAAGYDGTEPSVTDSTKTLPTPPGATLYYLVRAVLPHVDSSGR